MLLWQARMELLMVLICCLTGALVMRVCHTMDPVFDDPNLIGFGGLPAVMSLAERAGLHDLVDQHVTVPGSAGANAAVKVAALVAGMVVGADSSDLDVLRHGGMGRAFTGLRAPTTLGTHLRGYRFGHVRQLDAVAPRLLGHPRPTRPQDRSRLGAPAAAATRLRHPVGPRPGQARRHPGQR